MKVIIKHMELNKSRANLVKVAKQVQGKTGTYQSHRWINPNKAMDMLKEDLKKQGMKDFENLKFTDKETGKSYSEKELISKMQEEKYNGTLQTYAKQFKISSKKSDKRVENSGERGTIKMKIRLSHNFLVASLKHIIMMMALQPTTLLNQ